ncbi:MAG: UDP-N-acetylmuramate--L-alanine ligase [Lachnospiraceae bacterium]|nr:UDP-N-acetylmuramate--L-alanine ligase [Lachnospiraceae bacterium]
MYTLDFSKPVKVYFVGIGGISMSGLAVILKRAGFDVSGSDRDRSEVTENLEREGIKVFYGQKSENVTADIDVAVLTAAIRPDNPEYKQIEALNIPKLTRAELLGQLMRNYGTSIAISGTHGKTTTTSMISEILLAEDADPTISVGGMLPSIGGNIRVGGRDYFVTEACEYTNSFLSLFPDIALILNVEEDHLDFFKDLDDIRASFRKFADLVPENGTLIINSHIENIRYFTEGLKCKVLTFGLTENGSLSSGASSAEKTGTSEFAVKTAPDYTAANITKDALGNPTFDVIVKGEKAFTVKLSVPGDHNILNALAACAFADAAGIDRTVTAAALEKFEGTDRRFQKKGKIAGGVTLIDDYAHHPTEIRATMKAALSIEKKTLWVVFQPHTYTRTKAFFDDFADALSLADKVVLADIYAARETDTLGISSKLLAEALAERGTESYYFPSFEEIEKFLLKNCQEGDVLITMGAGDVYKIGDSLLGR